MRSAIGPAGSNRGAVVQSVALALATAASLVAGCASTPAGLRNLDRACAQGSRTACSRLGIAYYEGKDEAGGPIPLDHRRARQWFEVGCQRGLGESCYFLGTMCLRGEGGPLDGQRGVDLWRRACELGDGLSCRKTAEGYVDGSVGVKSRDLAHAYAKQGCERGDKPSCAIWKQLGGKPPPSPEVVKLMTEITAACERKGDAKACFALGEIFDQGLESEVNKEKAAQNYRTACEKGEPRGCHQLGVMMIMGEGIPPAPARGLAFLSRACDAKLLPSCDQLLKVLTIQCNRTEPDADACTVLGRLHLKGERGIDTNIIKGVEYLRPGCRGGDNDGCEDLRRLGL